MNAGDHAGRLGGERIIDEPDVLTRQQVRILATGLRARTLRGVAKTSKVRVIPLQVGEAGRPELPYFLLIGRSNVGIEIGHVGIQLATDARATAAEMQHGLWR